MTKEASARDLGGGPGARRFLSRRLGPFWGAHSAGVFAVALAGFLADQAFKLWMLFDFDIAARAPVALTPFFDLVLVWNYGVSYGLFQQTHPTGQWFLAAIGISASVVLWLWGARTRRRLLSLALGLIIGGALGNSVDRLAYGAVADFFHFYVGSFSWYVFNLADVWIVAGVALILYDGLIDGRGSATNTD